MTEFTRREVLWLSLPAFLRVVVALPSIVRGACGAQSSTDPLTSEKPLSWDSFLDLVGAAAKGQFLPGWDEEAYVREIERLAVRLRLDDPFLAAALRRSGRMVPGFPEFTALKKGTAFDVTLISFESGEMIPHHDHPQMTGVLTCATGQLVVENYDLLSVDGVDHSHCVLRKAHDMTLAPGQVSILTATSRNIHRVQAKGPCQVIDIFTPPYNVERVRRTRWYEIAPEPALPNS